MPEGSSLEELKASLQAYEVMRPKFDDIADDHRGVLTGSKKSPPGLAP
jgi:hypothetical protein